MSIKIYGIKNCDTMKKAFTWLSDHGFDFEFHDYKKSGITRQHLERWADQLGWENLVNRSGTTFRKLPESEKTDLDREKALELMLRETSIIKRPVIDNHGKLVLGFKPEIYESELKRRS